MRLTWPRFTMRRGMFFVVVAAFLLALLPLAWRVVRFDCVDDSYALWGAGEMVINYMKDHDDRWPKDWEDLKPYFDAGGSRVGGWSFSEYQRRVTIRWDVDPESLESAAKGNPRPTFKVIYATLPFAGAFEGREPNEILHRYLQEKLRRKP
jgi:hypothetical protein